MASTDLQPSASMFLTSIWSGFEDASSTALVLTGSAMHRVDDPEAEPEAEVVLRLDVDAEFSEHFPVFLSLTARMKKAKRRQRWGQTADDVLNPTAAASGNKRRRMRWNPENERVDLPQNVLFMGAAANLSPDEVKAMILRLKIDELTKKIANPLLALSMISEDERSPSPEPQYDAQGKRLNTRCYRFTQKLIGERHERIQEAFKVMPDFKPPSDYRAPRITAKIWIPVDRFPDYGFMGVIIGPRGVTHKKLERETGTKIAVRGKGTVKESQKGRGPQPGEDEDMHVYIQGDTQDSVDRASKMIRQLLTPDDENTQLHKQEQLKQLALQNGTVRDELRCRVCNESGHKVFECPQRLGASWAPANVVCEICGESSHITRDCRRLENKDFAEEKQKLNGEYDAFMAELTGDRASVQATKPGAPLLALTGPSAPMGQTGQTGQTGQMGQAGAYAGQGPPQAQYTSQMPQTPQHLSRGNQAGQPPMPPYSHQTSSHPHQPSSLPQPPWGPQHPQHPGMMPPMPPPYGYPPGNAPFNPYGYPPQQPPPHHLPPGWPHGMPPAGWGQPAHSQQQEPSPWQ